MDRPAKLTIALKEWAVVCAALGAGRQILLLRKGGIYESSDGFEIENRNFLFFPTYLHQQPLMLKDEALVWHEHKSAEPERVTLSLMGSITDILQVTRRAQVNALEAEHIWTPPLIDMRFNYKPQNPLYLLLVRAALLPQPIVVENSPAYAGCKSWVPLDETIDVHHARPVLDNAAYAARRMAIIETVGSTAG